MHKKFLRKLNLVKKGMNLVEIVVAIGVSSIALTTSAIFSTRLIYESQENFMAESSAQFQSVIAEQLRLVEADMASAVIQRQQGNATARPSSFPAGTPDPWVIRLCQQGSSTVPQHYSITLPKVVTPGLPVSELQPRLTPPSGTFDAVTIDGKAFTFIGILDRDKLTGAFSNIGDLRTNQVDDAGTTTQKPVVSLAIRMTELSSASLGNTIQFEIMMRYFVLNKTQPNYSEITTIRMVKSTVCP